MVKVSDECAHDESLWKKTPCGHYWCELCGGHVDPASRTALTGAGPVIECNRRRRPWVEYDYVFREWFAGSGVLTTGMRTALGGYAVRRGKSAVWGKSKVAKERDILLDTKWMDLTVKQNVDLAKKEMKSRSVFYEHFAPPCTTSSRANTRYPVRTWSRRGRKRFPRARTTRRWIGTPP